MFIQPCFIKKITPELKKELKALGYKDCGNYGESQYIYCEGGIFYESPCIIKTWYNNFINCECNEELCLAIAALRDDSDYMQWFICQEEYISTHTMDFVKVGTWQLNTQHDKLTYGLKHLWRKSTVEELISHFK
jgi:hypothetical protein